MDNNRIVTGFGAESTAAEVIDGIDLGPANAKHLWDLSQSLIQPV